MGAVSPPHTTQPPFKDYIICILEEHPLQHHLRWKGEEEGNPGLVARNTEWFCSSRGVRASAGVEVTIIDSQPMQVSWLDELRTK